MNDKKLLTSFQPLELDLKSIKENREANGGKIILRGIMQRADAVNQNGRIYPRSVLEREVENYQKFIRERRALGELDHPTASVVNLQNASHLVTEVRWEGDAVMGVIELLSTPMGKIAQSLVEDGVKLGISSRGVGSTKPHGDYDMVDDDFMLLCFDLVSEPSTSGAFMLREGRVVDPRNYMNKTDRIDRVLTDILHYKK
jgi:Prohead core protein serine protease